MTSPFLYYGFVISTFVAFTIPLEAVRLAPQWQSTFVMIERIAYGSLHIVSPIWGYLSDDTVSTWGKRRPWFILGGLMIMGFQMIMWYSSKKKIVWVFFVGLVGTVLGKNICMYMTQSMFADLIPAEHTGMISGFYTGQAAIGCILGFGYQGVFPNMPIS